MNLESVFLIVGILVAALIYFFVHPNENQEFEPQQPVNPPDNGEPAEPVKENFEKPKPVEQLEISGRIVSALKDSNIRVVAELRNLDGDFQDINGIGSAYAEEIRQALREE